MMDSQEGPSKGSAHHHNNHTHNNAPAPPNPPSIEAAYKHKCIELKKRLNEVEAANDAMRIRNAQGHRYIQKMRLESCMLLERLAVLTGMAEEQGISTELRARTVALLKEMDPHYTPAAHGGAGRAGEGPSSAGVKRAFYGIDYMDDGTEGSSEGHPPTVCYLRSSRSGSFVALSVLCLIPGYHVADSSISLFSPRNALFE